MCKWTGVAALAASLFGCGRMSGQIDTKTLKDLQGEWVVTEWTGYKPLALYDGYMAVSKDNDYRGSKLTVSGANTTWQLRITQDIKQLLLGLFSENPIAKKEGDVQFYTDKASIVALQNGKPGKLRFAGSQGGTSKKGPSEYAAIWTLQDDQLTICKAKNPGEECSKTLEIPEDDFFNTRVVLRRADKGKGACHESAGCLNMPGETRLRHVILKYN